MRGVLTGMRWITLVLVAGCARNVGPDAPAPRLPVGAWSQERVATHLLNRLAFGPSPADRAAIAAVGPDAWVDQQLRPGRDEAMDARLANFKAITLSVEDAFRTYPRPDKGEPVDRDLLPRQVLLEATQARLLRAANASRQLDEVLVDFWFNHFNVSAEKGRTRWMVAAYEREAIRPHVHGRFRDLLGATAKHPAMLFYLDNWLSTRDGFDLADYPKLKRIAGAMKQTQFGLNENYARELMELHTLGVNAGYTQDDVREAARALSGWSLELRAKSDDFGGFVYRDLTHDQGPKQIFGLSLPAGGKMDDGEKLLDHLARHPATARFLALKLCRRFVADEPPSGLVDRVAAEYLRTDGDLTAVYRAIFASPELWSDSAFAAKTKTPFEFVVSAIRAVGTLDSAEQPLGAALEQLGMPLYRAQPPTGYAETADGWISAGALVSRINFGLRLAKGQVKGVRLQLPASSGTEDAVIDALSTQLLGGAASDATRATLKSAIGDDGLDEVDVGLVAGLLLGSPEFQKQ